MTVDPVSAATVVGVGGIIGALTMLGLEPGPLFWALWGACIGMSSAEPTTRGRAILVFVCVVLISSLFGVWAATKWFGGEAISRNTLSCIFAIFFHPAFNAAITRVPSVFDAVLRRFGGDAAKGEAPK